MNTHISAWAIFEVSVFISVWGYSISMHCQTLIARLRGWFSTDRFRHLNILVMHPAKATTAGGPIGISFGYPTIEPNPLISPWCMPDKKTKKVSWMLNLLSHYFGHIRHIEEKRDRCFMCFKTSWATNYCFVHRNKQPLLQSSIKS